MDSKDWGKRLLPTIMLQTEIEDHARRARCLLDHVNYPDQTHPHKHPLKDCPICAHNRDETLRRGEFN